VSARAAGWLLAAGMAGAPAQPGLAPIAGPSSTPSPSWRMTLLPKQTLAATRFDVVDIDGVRALRVESRASYGNLLHRLDTAAPTNPVLSWRWRLERAIDGADLRGKASDDAAAKVCVMFDHPIDGVPFVERQLLRMARASTGEDLPAATLCYVWAPAQPADTVLPNAYTRRMRWLVLQGSGSPLGAWRSEQRDLRTDFQRAFGDEASAMPPVTAVLVGADADNTGGHGLAYVADLVLR
jgi:Protein of unknown function (DUF3047)